MKLNFFNEWNCYSDTKHIFELSYANNYEYLDIDITLFGFNITLSFRRRNKE